MNSPADISQVEKVDGPEASILFDAKKCVHSRYCVLGRPDVFVPNVEGAWIHPERASGEEIAALAQSCPSGAIRYVRHDGKPDEQPPKVNTVRVLENGPLAIRADVSFRDMSFFRATLCRCGASANKPFCDGSHVSIAFKATGEPGTKPDTPLDNRSGRVVLQPAANGPLKLSGPVEIISGTGHTVQRMKEAYLCRCGHSQNKPFCDGSHTKAGFKAD